MPIVAQRLACLPHCRSAKASVARWQAYVAHEMVSDNVPQV